MSQTDLSASRFSFEGIRNRCSLAYDQGIASFFSCLWVVVKTVFWLTLFAIAHWQAVVVIVIGYYVRQLLKMSWTAWAYDSLLVAAAPEVKEVVAEVVPPWVYGLMAYAGLITVVLCFVIMKPSRVVKVCDHGFVVERAMPGSSLIHLPAPEFIGVVFVQLAGVKQRAGVFFRVGNFLYTAEHVVAGAERVWFVYKGLEVEVVERPTVIDFDVIRYSYTPFSHWQMGAGKFSKRTQESYCQVHNGDVCTYGRLTRGAVGYLDYSGTTERGFSGAPFYANKTIYGIHMGAGVMNTGYDAANIVAIENYLSKESGADGGFTTDLLELERALHDRGDELEYRVTPNDYYIVRIGGVNKTYSDEEFEKVYQRYQGKRNTPASYQGETLAKALVKPAYLPESATDFTFQDSEPVPVTGNGMGPAAAASAPAGPSYRPDAVCAQLQNIVGELKSLSSRLSSLERSNTTGQPSTSARPKEAFRSILENSPNEVEAWKALGCPMWTTGPLVGLPNVSKVDWKNFCAVQRRKNLSESE